MGTALSAVLGLGYGRGAYAQGALSGAQTDTQVLIGPGEFVTEDGFSVDTTGTGSGGNAITITTDPGETGVTFNDNYASSITGANGGISAGNAGTGALSITTTGEVRGSGNAIFARNGVDTGNTFTNDNGTYTDYDPAGTSLTIDALGSVIGEDYGIFAENAGSGDLIIESTGDVIGGTRIGIAAYNREVTDVGPTFRGFDPAGEDISITANNVTGDYRGIRARQYGTGDLEVTTSGTISGAVGIYADIKNKNNTQPLLITAEGPINSTFSAVRARNVGVGDIDVNIDNSIVSDYTGVLGNSLGAGNVRVHITEDIQVGSYGVNATTFNGESTFNGQRVVEVTSSGRISQSGTNWSFEDWNMYAGVYAGAAVNSDEVAANVNIDVVDVIAYDAGIYAWNHTGGEIEITSTGDIVSETEIGVGAQANTKVGDITITVDNVSGGTHGI